jgi:hypothetical protein
MRVAECFFNFLLFRTVRKDIAGHRNKLYVLPGAYETTLLRTGQGGRLDGIFPLL